MKLAIGSLIPLVIRNLEMSRSSILFFGVNKVKELRFTYQDKGKLGKVQDRQKLWRTGPRFCVKWAGPDNNKKIFTASILDYK